MSASSSVHKDKSPESVPSQDEAHVAFGGERNSGLGRFNGEWAIEEFTTDHTIGVKRLASAG